MTLLTDIFPDRTLVSRIYYTTPGDVLITAPAGANIIRVSGVGAGGRSAVTASVGGGAAFARTKTACLAGAQFTIRVGDPVGSVYLGTDAGNSFVRRESDGVYLMVADRGKGASGYPDYIQGTKGLAINSLGDVKRDGVDPNFVGGYQTGNGGASGSDDSDAISLGIGGRGETYQYGAEYGGGAATIYVADGPPNPLVGVAGCGQVCVEFFNKDPGY